MIEAVIAMVVLALFGIGALMAARAVCGQVQRERQAEEALHRFAQGDP